MIIKYGVRDNNIDITDICMKHLKLGDEIIIPKGDSLRAQYFTDPLYGVLKSVFIYIQDEIKEYKDDCLVRIDLTNEIIYCESESDINEKLGKIHSNIKLLYGNLCEELPEQKMSIRYLTGNEKVLEIGGNIGRNTLVISNIIDSKNLVTLESDSNIAMQLEENRVLNGFEFHIENSALSKRKLIQNGWITTPSETLLNGYKWVNTITYEQLIQKYNIDFDTLVLDCEGAFYYILMDMPEILNNIKLIIMENDYNDISHKNYIDEVLKNKGFYRDYVEKGGWGCCYNMFFETWKKQ